MKTQVYYNDIDNFCCDVLEKNIRSGYLYSGIVDRRNVIDISGEELKQYGQVHLFAGIGAFPLGFRWAGMPASISIVTAGVPCQPHSVAGKRKGKEDDRNLWPETIRVIAELQPTWFVFENVPGIRTTILDEVLSDLDGLAYSTRTLIVPACAFNAPHRRERIFICAYAGGKRQPKHNSIKKECKTRNESQYKSRTFRDIIPNPNEQGLAQRQSVRSYARQEQPTLIGANWWIIEPSMGELVNGVSDRLVRFRGRTAREIPNRVKKLNALGNAVVPQVAQWLGGHIMEVANQ